LIVSSTLRRIRPAAVTQQSLSPHGYLGIEQVVVPPMVDRIKTH
jgi:hypothetical protein